MTASTPAIQLLTAHEWIHAYEKDSSGDEVYRPVTVDLPLSRRPRERLQCKPDGTGFVAVGGPDDRSQVLPATWVADGEQVVIRLTTPSASRTTYRVVSISADRLLVRVS